MTATASSYSSYEDARRDDNSSNRSPKQSEKGTSKLKAAITFFFVVVVLAIMLISVPVLVFLSVALVIYGEYLWGVAAATALFVDVMALMKRDR